MPLLAGLAIAAVVGWLLVPHQKFQSLTQVLIVAAMHTGLTVAASAVVFRITSYLIHSRVGRGSSFSIGIASWIAPLAVCVTYASVLALPLSVLVAGSIASVVRRGYGNSEETKTPFPRSGTDKKIFQMLPPPPFSKFLWMSLSALSLQAALIAALSGRVVAGAVLAGLAGAFIVWKTANYRSMRAAARRLRNLVSSWIVLALAFLLTVGSMHSRGGGTGNVDAPVDTKGGGDGHFRGIFLFPDRPPEEPPRQVVSLPFQAENIVPKPRAPVTIRFDGEYWFFQFPDLRPPSNATVMHGVPAEVKFRSTNSQAIAMEAHQTLSAPVELSNYRSVLVEVRNSDSHPGAIPLELVVSNGKKPRNRLSFGTADIAERAFTDRTGKMVTLDFPVPSHPHILNFDQLTFRFLPNSERWRFSPAISIESITLIPR